MNKDRKIEIILLQFELIANGLRVINLNIVADAIDNLIKKLRETLKE